VQDDITEAANDRNCPGRRHSRAATRDAHASREASMPGPPISAACGISTKSVGRTTHSLRGTLKRPSISTPTSLRATRASHVMVLH
jgi:hypothetical protein